MKANVLTVSSFMRIPSTTTDKIDKLIPKNSIRREKSHPTTRSRQRDHVAPKVTHSDRDSNTGCPYVLSIRKSVIPTIVVHRLNWPSLMRSDIAPAKATSIVVSRLKSKPELYCIPSFSFSPDAQTAAHIVQLFYSVEHLQFTNFDCHPGGRHAIYVAYLIRILTTCVRCTANKRNASICCEFSIP
jgi:hypothetical protein